MGHLKGLFTFFLFFHQGGYHDRFSLTNRKASLGLIISFLTSTKKEDV
jgi:hypothetical protein